MVKMDKEQQIRYEMREQIIKEKEIDIFRSDLYNNSIDEQSSGESYLIEWTFETEYFH